MDQRPKGRLLRRSFFERPPDDVALELIGAVLVVNDATRQVRAQIVETEAYGGSDDPASHAFRGPTTRCAVMFGPAGHLYVYRSYGIHWCANVVTQGPGTASAVLLRAAQVTEPAEEAGGEGAVTMLRGPGNLTRGLSITDADNWLDCCAGTNRRISFLAGQSGETSSIGVSARIGIARERDRLSRYFLEGHPAVTRVPAARSREA